MEKFYGVHVGRKCGVYRTWAEVKEQVDGFKGARQKRFDTLAEAEAFVKNGSSSAPVAVAKKRESLLTVEGDAITLAIPDQAKRIKTTELSEEPEDNSIYIFTDGSFSTKTKRSGVGVAFDVPYKSYAIAKRMPDNTTNQQAELDAIVCALFVIKQRLDLKQDGEKRGITIWTDSMYSCDCLGTYIHMWRRNGWLTAGKQPVKHKHIIQEAARDLESMPFVKLRHISEVGLKSHDKESDVAGLPLISRRVWAGNDVADKLAKGL